MAKMFPAKVYSGTKSPGEAEVFHRLSNDPETTRWIVLHSLDVADHISQIQGELDFLIIVPHKGVLCLEVKAARSITRKGGAWYYGSSVNPDVRGPFKQVSGAMHSLRRKLTKHIPELSKVMFCSAVLFPYVEFSATSPEWHTWQVIDAAKYEARPLGQLLEDVIDEFRKHYSGGSRARWFDPAANTPTGEQCRTIATCLRPEFEFYESPKSRITRRERELKQFTGEQLSALDAMVANPRVLFEGPAGTGKTLLAIEETRRAVTGGETALLVCYNRLLGQWLSKEVSHLGDSVTCRTLHALMLDVTGVNVPKMPQRDFWEEELPKAAIFQLKSNASRRLYDMLVVDEAQDIFFSDMYTEVLDLCLVDGLSKGMWRAFGDFEGQSIYGPKGGKMGFGPRAILENVPRYTLRTNCRNPPRIAEFVNLLGGLDPHYRTILRSDNGYEPEILIYQDRSHQAKLLEAILRTLDKRGYEPYEIAILSTRTAKDSVAQLIHDRGGFQLQRLSTGRNRGITRFGSIHEFKGLEAPIVIVTDIEGIKFPEDAPLFYTSISRATERLYILASDLARSDLLEIIASDY